MRIGLIACAVLIAGCTSPVAEEPTPDSEIPPSPDDQSPPSRLPADIDGEIAYFGAFEGAGAAVGEPCAFQPWCFDYQFHVDEQAHMEAELVWSIVANDLDLLLLRDDEVVERAERRGDVGPETLALDLGPGDYTLRVVPYFVPDEPDARLTARFSPTDSS